MQKFGVRQIKLIAKCKGLGPSQQHIVGWFGERGIVEFLMIYTILYATACTILYMTLFFRMRRDSICQIYLQGTSSTVPPHQRVSVLLLLRRQHDGRLFCFLPAGVRLCFCLQYLANVTYFFAFWHVTFMRITFFQWPKTAYVLLVSY